MNITQTISDERHLVKEISSLECLLVEALCHDTNWLTHDEESTLRWALSMARVSTIETAGKDISVGHATDRYRESLFATISHFVKQDGTIKKAELRRFIAPIGKLCADEREDLLQLFGAQLSPQMLDDAVRSRPLALVLGGGGGTAYIYVGAFELLERRCIVPAAISGSSMGALLGAYRARTEEFSLSGLEELLKPLSFETVARPFEVGSKRSIPATFRLYLREVFASEFQISQRNIRLSDLHIPVRVCVGGLAHIEGVPDENLDEYAHLLNDGARNIFGLRGEQKTIVSKLLELSRRPLKAIYLGADEKTREFDVIDALGFSAAVPGIFNYDVPADDARMTQLVDFVMKKHGVYRLIDGGWVDNMPAEAAMHAVQEAKKQRGRDPFILALDGFAPNIGRHWLFLPLMQMALQNSKAGRSLAHRTITYKHVLSPLNIMPNAADLERAIHQGMEETDPHMDFIEKMVGPIPNPSFLKTDM